MRICHWRDYCVVACYLSIAKVVPTSNTDAITAAAGVWWGLILATVKRPEMAN